MIGFALGICRFPNSSWQRGGSLVGAACNEDYVRLAVRGIESVG